MKFFATALFAAAVVSADTVFTVTDFAASCTPHSVECSYAFKVAAAGETTPVSCSVQAGSDNSLPSASGTCKKSSRTFTVTRGTTGLTVAVSQQVSAASTQTGSHLIPFSQITTTSDQVGKIESYTGPTTFTLDS